MEERADVFVPEECGLQGQDSSLCEQAWIDVCASEALVEGGDGVRFEWPDPAGAGHAAAFVVRFDGQARAYLNRCAHRPGELDWLPGRFFDEAGLYLICATHGAAYEADTGRCVAGPCRGASLAALHCEERDGRVRVARRARVDRPDPGP